MMRAGFTIGLLLVSTGCHLLSPGDDDDDDDVDAAARGAGLEVVIYADIDNSNAKDGPPADVTLTGLSRVELELEDVRAIGDAAPGDERTTIPRVVLDWHDDDVECLEFDNVPPGIYSRLLARVVRYRIDGTVEDSNLALEFTIEDTPPTPLSLTVDTEDVVVDVNEDGVLALELSIAPVLDAVDWEAQSPDGEGHVDIDGASSDIDGIRAAMGELLRPGGDPETGTCPQ